MQEVKDFSALTISTLLTISFVPDAFMIWLAVNLFNDLFIWTIAISRANNFSEKAQLLLYVPSAVSGVALYFNFNVILQQWFANFWNSQILTWRTNSHLMYFRFPFVKYEKCRQQIVWTFNANFCMKMY